MLEVDTTLLSSLPAECHGRDSLRPLAKSGSLNPQKHLPGVRLNQLLFLYMCVHVYVCVKIHADA